MSFFKTTFFIGSCDDAKSVSCRDFQKNAARPRGTPPSGRDLRSIRRTRIWHRDVFLVYGRRIADDLHLRVLQLLEIITLHAAELDFHDAGFRPLAILAEGDRTGDGLERVGGAANPPSSAQ